jgi:VanZ family protein
LSKDEKPRVQHKLASVAAWAWLAFIGFATLSPAHLRPELTATEPAAIVMLEHVGAFAVLGILFSVGYPRRSALVLMIVFGSAVLLEFAQIAIPGRDARLVDAAEKLAGGGFGVATCYLASLVGLRRKSSRLLE